jgi:hypothetical protein
MQQFDFFTATYLALNLQAKEACKQQNMFVRRTIKDVV